MPKPPKQDTELMISAGEERENFLLKEINRISRGKRFHLNKQQWDFVYYLLLGRNITQAAKLAKYSEKTAHAQGSRLFKDVKIVEVLEYLKYRMCECLQITPERIAKERARLAFSNIADFLKIDKNGKAKVDLSSVGRDQLAAVATIKTDDKGFVKEIRLDKKGQAITDLSRQLKLEEKPGDIHIHNNLQVCYVDMRMVLEAPKEYQDWLMLITGHDPNEPLKIEDDY